MKHSGGTITLSGLAGSKGYICDGDWVESRDQDKTGEVRLVQLADVGAGRFLDKSNRRMTLEAAKRLRCTFLKRGDILIARMPDPIGRACIFPGDSLPCVTVVDVCVLRVDADIADPRYVVHMINSTSFLSTIGRFVKGTTRQRIARTSLEALSIPLPSVSEQLRIIEILDRADSLRSKRLETLKKIDNLRLATFQLLLELRNESWASINLSSLCNIVRGSSPRPQGDPRFFGGPVPRLMISDITRDGMMVRPRIDSLTEEGAKRSRPMPAGSVVMAVSGAIGLPAILEVDSCIHDGFVGFRSLNSTIAPKYLYYWLLSMRSENRSRATGAIWINLTTDQVGAFLVPVPPLELQLTFVARIDQINAILATQLAHQRLLETLFASLQQRAFFGLLSGLPVEATLASV